MKRHLLGIVTLAAAASLAGAQQTTPASQHPANHGESVSASHRNTSAGTRSRGHKARRTYTSRGEVASSGSPRAHPRDYVGADDTRCDDLCQRERMLDQKYGKDRERLHRP